MKRVLFATLVSTALYAAAPSVPTDISVANVYDRNITLDWIKTYTDEANTTIYIVNDVNATKNTSIVLAAGTIPPVVVSGLEPYTPYSFVVSPGNSDGETNSTETNATTTHTWNGLMLGCADQALGKPKGYVPTKNEYALIKSFACSYHGAADIRGICDLVNAEKIDMRGNWIRQRIPSCIKNLSRLTYLDLSGNLISGDIPPEIGTLTDLKKLDLSNNRISNIPAELGNLSSLEELHLAYNSIEQKLPAELGNLSSLEKLYLQGNRFFGHIPAELGDMMFLRRMRLNDNRLRGPIPIELADLDLDQPSGLGLHENCRLELPADSNVSDDVNETADMLGWIDTKASLWRGYNGVVQTGGKCWTSAIGTIVNFYLLSDSNDSNGA